MKNWTHEEWLKGATLENGIYWREADGRYHRVSAKDKTKYGLR